MSVLNEESDIKMQKIIWFKRAKGSAFEYGDIEEEQDDQTEEEVYSDDL